MIRCDKCSKRAIIYQKYSGKHLCVQHFEEDVHRKVKEVLRPYRIFNKNCKIAVAVSGGKDSTSLLYILHSLFISRKDVDLIAVSIDEGIEGYRSKTIEAARSVAERLEVPHVIKSFSGVFGITTDQIVSQDHAQAPCTFCGVLRKSLLNRTARDLDADALATGHNLDDESQTVLLNYLKGDIDRLYRLRPRRDLNGMVPRIKPLRRVPEREMALYAITHDLPIDTSACPHIPRAIRLEIKNMLNEFESRHPGTKYSIMRGFDRILELQPEREPFQPVPCSKCGEPSSDGICQCCRLLEQVRAAQSL
ncbi:MAG: TIGR00269 family protein [Methanotrichaceae archaeon]